MLHCTTHCITHCTTHCITHCTTHCITHCIIHYNSSVWWFAYDVCMCMNYCRYCRCVWSAKNKQYVYVWCMYDVLQVLQVCMICVSFSGHSTATQQRNTNGWKPLISLRNPYVTLHHTWEPLMSHCITNWITYVYLWIYTYIFTA